MPSMQTITVNGIKISYNSNVKKKSTESNIPLADDGLSLMIQATEAYVESGYQIKALEAIGAFSTEAAPGFVKKIGGGIKAVIEKIKQFFVYISSFIKSVFLSGSIKMQALAIHHRLKKDGIREDWKEVKVAGCGNITKGLKHISATRKIIGLIKKYCNAEDMGMITKVATMFINQYDKIVQSYNQTSFTATEVPISKLVSDPQKEIIGQLGAISSFTSDISGGLLEVVAISNILSHMCDGLLAEKTLREETPNTVKLFRTLQHCINSCSKMYTGVCKSIINIGKYIAVKPQKQTMTDIKNAAKDMTDTAKTYAKGATEIPEGVKKYGLAKTARDLIKIPPKKEK